MHRFVEEVWKDMTVRNFSGNYDRGGCSSDQNYEQNGVEYP